MKNLTELSKLVNQLNIKWWQDPITKQPIERNKGELLMLVITELAEACEGVRKNLMDDKLPHRKMEEVEMADAKIRLLDFAGGFDIPLLDVYFNEVGITLSDNKAEAMLQICGAITMCYSYACHPWHLSRCLCAIEEYCAKFDLDLEGAMEEKIAFNYTRADHTHEHRLSENGKKF